MQCVYLLSSLKLSDWINASVSLSTTNVSIQDNVLGHEAADTEPCLCSVYQSVQLPNQYWCSQTEVTSYLWRDAHL